MGCAAALSLAAADGIAGAWLGLDRWVLHAPVAALIRGLGFWMLLLAPTLVLAVGLMATGLRPWISVALGAAATAGGLALAEALRWSGGAEAPLLASALKDTLFWLCPVAVAQSAALTLGMRIAAGWRLRVEPRAPRR